MELTSQRLAGMTHFASVENGPHEVALAVHPEMFLTIYCGTTGAM